jgi:hypothetical protein
MRKSFENQLSQEWNIRDPEMFELNEKGNYKFGAVDRVWAYYQLYEAVLNLNEIYLNYVHLCLTNSRDM